jgi:hypothetical protein
MGYCPTVARWLSRDPLDTEEVTLLDPPPALYPYCYVNNSPINYVDPSGLELPPAGSYGGYHSQADACACWEKSEQNIDPTWLTVLPACPCSLGSPPKNPDPEVWYDPADADKRFHPARWCIRSHPVPYFPNPWGIGTILACQPGQQCCYDGSGNLITHGSGAGTPDFSAPVGVLCVLSHYLADVRPFFDCPLTTYLTYRPPDNRNNCTKNPP